MPKKKLKDVSCEEIMMCFDCPFNGINCGEIKMDEKFGDFFKRNPESILKTDLEKEVDVFDE